MKIASLLLLVCVVLLLSLAATRDMPDTLQMAPMALNSYTWVPGRIVAASVTDLDRDTIGTVRKVDVDQNGKPQGLQVLLSSSGQVIRVTAANVSYDEGQNIVTLGLSKSQVAAAMTQTGPRTAGPQP